MARKASRWIPLFRDFVKDLRISSKEVVSEDARGVKMKLWDSQRRFLEEVGQGLDEDIRIFKCLKSRQLGITSISLAIDVFWLALHPTIRGALVTDTEKNRESNRATLRNYIRSFPPGYFGDDFQIAKGGDNRQFMAFTNGARLDFLVAGVKKKSSAWGEGVGYAMVHLTELASYGDLDGLSSFEESFAQKNPQRLFLYESTAKGFNHWRETWMNGLDSPTERSFFIGWWANDMNRIEKSDPRFEQYSYGKTGSEHELMVAVAKMYMHRITEEQLAWIRWRQANATADPGMLEQNQPWTADQAFVVTGSSFFQTRAIARDLRFMDENLDLFNYYAYYYDYGNTFFDLKTHFAENQAEADISELKVFQEPVPGGKYVIGCDPAYGRNEHKDRHCLDEATEILTITGWKTRGEVNIGDVAVCFDPASGDYKYGTISDKVVKYYDGPMLHFKSKGLDCLATPEHRVVQRCYRVLRDGRKSDWSFRTAQQIADSGRSVREIPVGGAPIGKGIPNLSEDMCRALGWILTDGHIKTPDYVGNGKRKDQRERRPSIVLVQALTTEKMGINIASEMRKVMGRLCPNANIKDYPPSRPRHAPKVFIKIGVKESEQFINWIGDGGRIPRSILTDGSSKQLEALFQGILEGDGGWDPVNHCWVKVCPGHNDDLADDIQELALRLGYSATKAIQKAGTKGGSQWLVRLSRRTTHTFEANNVWTELYGGTVWCVTVPTGAFVARRRGKVFVTGNCIQVFRCFADKLVQCAEFATADIEVKHCAWVLAHLAGAYNDCVVNVELSGPGRMIIQEWEHLRGILNAEMYAQKVSERRWDEALYQARWYLYTRPDTMGRGYALNFETNWRTKQEIMHQVRGSYATRELDIKSRALFNEMSIVVQDGHEIGAPESRNEDTKDDRVFAMALAVRAWLNWQRPALIAAGETYEKVMKEERGETTKAERSVNNLVFRFLKTQQELAEMPKDDRPPWMVQYGLR